jgi:surface antigen
MKISFHSNKTDRHGIYESPLRKVKGMGITFVLMLMLGLSACSSLRDPFNLIVNLKEDQPPLPPAQLPDLRKGDFFIYGDNVKHTLNKVGKDGFSWLIGTEFEYHTSRNFVFPWLKWNTADIAWSSVVENNDIGDLWPLVVGNSELYKVENTMKKTRGAPTEYPENYDCQVAGTETVTVPAGVFDTFVVVCYRFIMGMHFKNNIYYYAPEIGLVVKKTEGTSVLELVGYGISLESLALEERREIKTVFQKTLQITPSGQSTVWRGKNSKDFIEITPKGTYLQDDGRYCRDYIQRIVLDGRERSIAGRSCRNAAGTWD